MRLASSDVAAVAARSVAAFALQHSSIGVPADPLDEESWGWLSTIVQQQRIWGLLANGIAEGSWPATPEQFLVAAESEESFAFSMLRLDQLLVELAGRFYEAGIEWRLLKGPAAAHLLWNRGELRPYSDIDILVRSSAFDRTARLIEESLDGVRQHPDPLPGLVAEVGKSAAFSLDGGWEIDLHRTLTSGPFGAKLAVEDLWSRPQRFKIGGQDVLALSPESMFLHACMHAVLALDPRRIVPMRDVAEGLSRVGELIDPGLLLDQSERWRARAILALAVNRALEVFALETAGALPEWAHGYQPTLIEREYLWAQIGSFAARPIAETVATALAFPTWRERQRYVRGVLFHEDRDPALTRARRLMRTSISSLRRRDSA